MKTSVAGKLLGPQSDKWEVVPYGELLVIVSPGGRIFRLQQLTYGRWDVAAMEPADSRFFIEAANLLRDKNKEEQRVIDALCEAQDLAEQAGVEIK